MTARTDEPTLKALAVAGAPPSFSEPLRTLRDRSQGANVSGIWLLLSYLFATIGELCLSPVGLSMVTKLAPLRFAALFMGVWMLSSAVAQYFGGSIAELWGKVTPVSYFTIFVFTSLGGAVLLGLLVYPLRKLMHNVR
jgi:POT family proton-dependent oligopeptide transporter